MGVERRGQVSLERRVKDKHWRDFCGSETDSGPEDLLLYLFIQIF